LKQKYGQMKRVIRNSIWDVSTYKLSRIQAIKFDDYEDDLS